MRKFKTLKFTVLLLVTAMLLADLKPLANDGSWFAGITRHVSESVEKIAGKIREARAADSEEPKYSFLYPSGEGSVPNGGILNYEQVDRRDRELTITLQSSLGIVSGTSVTWDVSNTNIAQIASTSENGVRVTLKILSPGFTGLTVDVTDPNGTLHPAAAFCSIYVPLQWADAEENGNIMEYDIPSKYRYGLLTAQLSETSGNKTLQLYTSESSEYPDCYHYLRKLKYVTYEYTDEAKAAGKTGPIPSDVDPADLKMPQTALRWESSDTSVASVNERTGIITAHSAGFCRITVSSTSIQDEDSAKKSFNVVVVPESHAVGYTTENKSKYTIITDPDKGNIVFQMAKSGDEASSIASNLKWRLFQGDTPDEKKDITNKSASNMEISTTSGRVVLKDLPAGVYYLTAIPVKDDAAIRSSGLPSYGEGSGGISASLIEYMGITIIVPVSFPVRSIILNYYNENVFDTYNLLASSNLPAGAFRFFSDDIEVASVGVNDGVVEAKSVGVTKVRVGMTDSGVLEEIFGSYASYATSGSAIGASGSAIGYDGSDMIVDVTVVNGISLNSTSETMSVGSTLQLALTAPNPYQGEVTWTSSDEKVVTVDETGLVTAVGVGDANVVVRIKVGGVTKQARCRIKVISAVTGIVLTSRQDYVVVGDNLTISANITPRVNGAELVWSCSDTKLASIADASALSMTITGVKVGTVVVTALNPDNNMVATKVIKVVQEITGITLSDTQVTIAQTQKFYQLYAKVTPELPDNEALNWTTSDKKVVTVDQNGKVTLVKPGSAVITVSTKNGKMAQCTFTVTQGVTSIAFDENDVVMYVGEKHKLTYTLKPDNAFNDKVKWNSLNSKIATVDASGFVTAKNVGNAVITLQTTDGTGLYTTCNITVYRNATAIKLDVTSLSMNVGDVYNLETILTPADSSDIVSFESSNTKVATVSSLGKISAKAKGNCVILAKTPSGLTAYVSVSVTQQVTGDRKSVV